MPALYEVVVENAPSMVWLTREDAPGWHMRGAAVDGRVILKGLPAGTYRLGSNAGTNLEFTVPGTSTLRVE